MLLHDCPDVFRAYCRALRGHALSTVLNCRTGLIEAVAKAAKKRDSAIGLFLDEVQSKSYQEVAALIVACHEMAQQTLPFLFIGAGLSQLAALAGSAKPMRRDYSLIRKWECPNSQRQGMHCSSRHLRVRQFMRLYCRLGNLFRLRMKSKHIRRTAIHGLYADSTDRIPCPPVACAPQADGRR
jgi:hypothetical protein